MIGERFSRQLLLVTRPLMMAIFLAVSGSQAWAASKTTDPNFGTPMTFVVVRSNVAGCEPTCPEWISAEGSIVSNSPTQLKKLLKKLGDRKLPIVITSPGGEVEAAMSLGRLIRRNGFDVAVGKTWFTGCRPDQKNCHNADSRTAPFVGTTLDAGSYCASACPFVLAAGQRRLAGPGTLVGVHQVTMIWHEVRLKYRVTTRVIKGKKVTDKKVVGRKDVGTRTKYEMDSRLEKRIAAYLKEMGIGASLLTTIKNTPAKSIHYLIQDNMLAMKLLTGKETVALLTAKSLCRLDPMPVSCRTVPVMVAKSTKGVDQPKSSAQPVKGISVFIANGTSDSGASSRAAAGQTNARVASIVPADAKSVVKDAAGGKRISPPGGVEEVGRADDMRFTVVRSSDPRCEPDCPEWISADGVITVRTEGALRRLLAKNPGRRLPILLDSAGGDVLAAMEIGRLIRGEQLDVAVAQTIFAECIPGAGCTLANDPPYPATIGREKGVCASACVLLLASGVNRLVGSHARVTVYSLAFQQKISSYLQEMGIGADLLTAMQGAWYSNHRKLEPDEMQRMNLTTTRYPANSLIGSMICRQQPKPRNCRVSTASR